MNGPVSQTQAFWAFSLDVYARPRVAELCIKLQDDYGFDVNLMLLGLWLAKTGPTALDEQGLAALRAAAAPFNDNLVHPLRRARRWAKPLAGTASDPEAEAVRRDLYAAIKQSELKAERLVQSALIECLGRQRHLRCETAEAAAVSSLENYRRNLGAPSSAGAAVAELILRTLA